MQADKFHSDRAAAEKSVFVLQKNKLIRNAFSNTQITTVLMLLGKLNKYVLLLTSAHVPCASGA
jgi:hypothetical protein